MTKYALLSKLAAIAVLASPLLSAACHEGHERIHDRTIYVEREDHHRRWGHRDYDDRHDHRDHDDHHDHHH